MGRKTLLMNPSPEVAPALERLSIIPLKPLNRAAFSQLQLSPPLLCFLSRSRLLWMIWKPASFAIATRIQKVASLGPCGELIRPAKRDGRETSSNRHQSYTSRLLQLQTFVCDLHHTSDKREVVTKAQGLVRHLFNPYPIVVKDSSSSHV